MSPFLTQSPLEKHRFVVVCLKLIPLLRDFVINIFNMFPIIYDQLSRPYSLCALNYVLNTKEQQICLL